MHELQKLWDNTTLPPAICLNLIEVNQAAEQDLAHFIRYTYSDNSQIQSFYTEIDLQETCLELGAMLVRSCTMESVRSIIKFATMQSWLEHKFIIITDSSINSVCSNALLKISEEMPANTYLIFVCEYEALIPTLKSRVVKISLQDKSTNLEHQAKYSQILTDLYNEAKSQPINTSSNISQLYFQIHHWSHLAESFNLDIQNLDVILLNKINKLKSTYQKLQSP